MLKELDSYNWNEAFGYVGEPKTYARENLSISPVLGEVVEITPFTRENVVEIYALYEGEHDGESWHIAGKLADGRHFYLEAYCDYTGWDCQASGSAWVASSKKALLKFGLTDKARELLKL